MSVSKISAVVPVDDIGGAARAWAIVLEKEPSFIDGDAWAQFDIGASRLALAGTDRVSDHPGLMVKVDDIAAAASRVDAVGWRRTTTTQGAHELRFVATTHEDLDVIFYAPLPSTGDTAPVLGGRG